MDQEKTKATLKFVFEKSDNYIDVYATGVHGGIGPHGELNMYFIEDSLFTPESETLAIMEDGNAKIINQSYKEVNTIKRIVKCKVVMNPNDIPSIIEWLKAQYEQYKNMQNVVINK